MSEKSRNCVTHYNLLANAFALDLWLPQSCRPRSDRETEAHAWRRSKILQIFPLNSSKGQLHPIVGQRGTRAMLICGNDDASSVLN